VAAVPAHPLRTPAGVPLRRPVHPGRFLQRHYLGPLALSQGQAARLLGISRRRVHELVGAQRQLTPDTAIRCALAFGWPAADALALQAAWDSFHAWRATRQGTPAEATAPSRSAPRLRAAG
jgi:addiction module HigA family antidote